MIRVTAMLLILFASTLAAAWLPSAAAQAGGDEGGRGIGVTPNHLDFGSLLRAEPTQRFLEIQNGGNSTARIAFEREGVLANWTRAPAEPMTIPPRTTQQVPLTVEAPADARNGAYHGNLTVILMADDGADSGRVAVQVGVRVRLDAVVGGEEVIALDAGRFSVGTTEQGSSIPLTFTVRNRGNVRVTPEVDVQILGADRSVIHTETLIAPTIRAGAEETVTLRVARDLAPGQYWLRAVVRAGNQTALDETATFDVLEPGALRRNGQLGGIHTVDVEAKTRTNRLPAGAAFIVRAPFENTGEVDVDARFEGYILKGGVIQSMLNSSTLRVAAGENVTFELLVPGFEEGGTYSIRGKVYYSGKVTEENEWILNVQSNPAGTGAGGRGTPDIGVGALLVAAALVALLAGGRLRRRE